MTDDVNQDKGDQDPATWVPPLDSVLCRYVVEWVAVKTRWGLAVDPHERDALSAHASDCRGETVTVTLAP